MRKKQKYKYVTLFINRANLIDLNVIKVLQNWHLRERKERGLLFG